MADGKMNAFSRQPSEKHWKNTKFKQGGYNVKAKGFQDKHQRMVIRQYKQTLKEEKKQLQSQSGLIQPEIQAKEIQRLDKKIKMSSRQRAQEIYQRKQDEIKEKREEKARLIKEKEEAKAKYREEKLRKMRILRQRTRKGQPLMKGRIELLLEKIEKQVKQ
uniref:Thyroid transcription factor 1-associated protein 26 n=1 Tax=Strigamia maritima TaxID=126957 RepID=T1IXV3_STRMM